MMIQIKERYHQLMDKLTVYFERDPKRATIITVIIVFVLLLLLRLLINAIVQRKHTSPPAFVSLASVTVKNVPVYFSALGTVTSEDVITVKTQINGTLTKVNFQDGQFVKAGDVLAEIDSRPYQAALLQAEGQLLRDQALLDNAKIDLTRYQNLYKTHATSQQTLNTQASLVRQYEGAVKIDQGQINAAQTNLTYCKITSPVAGRIGIGIVSEGNFVQTSDTSGIAVVTTLDPIEVLFSLPQQDLPAVAEAFNNGNNLLPVEIYNRDQTTLLSTGKLLAIDNQVNVSTGTVQYEAEFANPQYSLFPNQFVNVKVQVKNLTNAMVIPTMAVQQGSNGAYVFRYNPTTQTVEHVNIGLGPTSGDNTVITSGLSAHQQVVTEGGDKLFDGAKVSVAGAH